MTRTDGRRAILLLLQALWLSLAACAHAPAAKAPPEDNKAAPAGAGKSVGEPPPGPIHKTFHYKADSVPGVFDQWGQGSLDPQTPDGFAAGIRYDCPGPGTLHVESEVEPEGSQLRIAVYTGGSKEVALTRSLEPLDAQIDAAGPCYVVVKVQDFSWECTFRVKASFSREKLRP
jgi:hypothetical protein